MKTLADLKRDAKEGKIFAKLIIRNGEQCTDINTPEMLKGYRKITDSNSNSITFLTPDGKPSILPIEKASLLEYNQNTITIYKSGERDFNAEEIKIMQQWREIEKTEEYQEQAKIDMITDGSTTYWKRVKFFTDNDALFLIGTKSKGKCYNHNTGKMLDDTIKGKISMKYEIKQN